MANFAKVDPYSGKVSYVIVIADSDCGGGNFPESEPIGQNFINNALKFPGLWKQTSYNGNFRQRLAGIDGIYDFDLDKFVPPKPYNSWILNTNTYDWESPIPYPDDGQNYIWNEIITNWELVPQVQE